MVEIFFRFSTTKFGISGTGYNEHEVERGNPDGVEGRLHRADRRNENLSRN